ncbi:MAG: glycosyltransferase family 4 protein [Thermoplasmata archaeon]
MPVRIALASPYFHPHIGGVESHVRSLAARLLRRGHEVCVFTSMYESLPADEMVDGIPVRRVRMRALLFQTPMTPALVPELLKERWDIIHSHSPPPLTSYYAAKASKRSRIPLILTYHCDPELPSPLGRLVSSVYQRTLLRYTLKRAARILVYTESYAATSVALWKYPTVCIPTGLEVEAFGPHVDGSWVRRKHGAEGKRMILFVGRMMEHKGIPTLLQALPLLPPDTLVLLVGPGEPPAAWRARAERLGVGKRVLFAGRVADSELPAYYAACDVLVLPSVSRLEAFGLVLVEAMASGRPVVASDLPGVREVFTPGETGFLFEPFNSRDLAEKLGRILSDDELRRRMGERARELARERYSWDVIGERIEGVYRDVLDARRA